MVAHDIADTPSLLAANVRRRPFFQEDPLITLLTLERNVMPPDEVEVGAMLRGGSFDRSDAGLEFYVGWRKHHEVVPSNADRIQAVEGTHKLQPNCPESIRVPTLVGGPKGIGRAQSAKASSMVLILFLLSHRHAAPLKAPATRFTFSSSITARMLRMSFFPMPRFS